MMNTKIEELARKAGYEQDMFGVGHYNMPEFQNFVDLFINECGIALHTMQRDMISRGQAYDLIKKHFGIE